MRLALVALLAACEGGSGTMLLKLTTAPGSTLLSSVDKIRLTLTAANVSFEAQRGPDGIDLELELEASDAPGTLLVEGYDASGNVIAAGQSASLSLAGADFGITIYVAPPYSIGEAPLRLPAARSHLAAHELIYGAVVAGGRAPDGTTTNTIGIYNVYSHAFAIGLEIPVRRADLTLAVNDTGGVYLLGGSDDVGAPTATLYRFQTNVAPSGAYADLGTHPGFESAGARAIQLASDTYLVTGNRPAMLAGGVLTARDDLPALPATAVRVAADRAAVMHDGVVDVIGTDSILSSVPLPVLDRAALAALPDGTALVVGGGRDVFVVSTTVTPLVDRLSVARFAPSVTATARHVVVSGGVDAGGAPIASADILDAVTLELVATIPVTPRVNAVALPLPNDQVMIVGGDEANDLIELFTPPVR